jgi:hypothetical protein
MGLGNGRMPFRRRRVLVATGLGAALAALAAMSVVVPVPAGGQAADEPLADPIPEEPTPAGIGLTVERVATLPQSEPTPATTDPRLVRWNRINYVGELPDGSGRRYVPDLNGTLYLLEGGTPIPYLDVKAEVGPNFWSGRGLGSGFGFVAFHPEFRRNGKFYTVHTEALGALQTETPDLPSQPDPVVHGVLTEWTADDPSADTFTGTRREMLRLGFRTFIHGYQQVAFNPTARRGDADYGLLYIGVGDGGAGRGGTEAQDLAMPQGKLFRIDPAGTDGVTGEYGIPRSNPFVRRAGALGEIYAYGLRNPHRFSWDPARPHRMFLGNIGDKRVESVYEVRPGDNFGWTEREGPFVVRDVDPECHVYPLPPDDQRFGYTYPVVAYDHDRPPDLGGCDDSGFAVIGGFVYRGRDVPALRGRYVFGDDVSGRLFYTETRDMRRGGRLAPIRELAVFDESGRQLTMADLAGDERVDLRFGQDSRGELYILAKANGTIWRVTGTRRTAVLPSLEPDLVAHYDFEHPVVDDPGREQDRGLSGTDIALVNGGAAMRTGDGAHRGSTQSMQTQQVNPDAAGNDDWKAGVYAAGGVPTLRAFNAARQVTVMGWFKMTGPHPNPNSNTPDPADRYNAVGLAGVLSGDSEGHAVRALLEVINVSGELRVVALGRRVDGSSSQTFAADADWQSILPQGEWVFLGATFDFDTGTMQLYRNGEPLDGFYTVTGDPWAVAGEPEPDVTSATDPAGIKLGGSFPQNTEERNPCNCRMDSLMFLDRVVTAGEMRAQYRRFLGRH